jgi:hypothetical protein
VTEKMKTKLFKIIGVYRNPRFSNNAVEADRKILEESIHLFMSSYEGARPSVDFLEEEELMGQSAPEAQLVLTMAQSENALETLDQWVKATTVLNSPASIRSCYRKTMSEILHNARVGYVPFQIIDTLRPQELLWPGTSPCWLKRSDFHAISDDDVVLAENANEGQQLLARFSARGIREVIAQKHIHGDIYKFYGVGDRFFKAICVRKQLDSSAEPNLELLRSHAKRAAEKLSVVVYGGDAILDGNGQWHLIDLNDWPSFRICRPEAAAAIAAECKERLAERAGSSLHQLHS